MWHVESMPTVPEVTHTAMETLREWDQAASSWFWEKLKPSGEEPISGYPSPQHRETLEQRARERGTTTREEALSSSPANWWEYSEEHRERERDRW